MPGLGHQPLGDASPPRTTTRARRSTAARRCSSTRAATTRRSGPTWHSDRIEFGGRKGFIRLALERDVPIVPVVAIGGQETALFVTRGERAAKATGWAELTRIKVCPVRSRRRSA